MDQGRLDVDVDEELAQQLVLVQELAQFEEEDEE